MDVKKLPTPKERPALIVTDQQRADGWENTITGIGRSRDKRTGTSIKTTQIQGSRDEFDEFYHGDHTAAKIARLPAREMTREWITLQVDDSAEDIEAGDKMLTAKQIMQALDDLKAKSSVAQALLWARVHGGALLFLGVDDGIEDLSEPLNMDSVKSFDFMLVFDRWDVQVQTVNTNLASERFGKPEVYLLQPQTETMLGATAGLPVHASRFVRFDGVPTSRWRKANNSGWADSVYTSMRETLQDYGITWHGVCNLLQDFSQAVLKMKGLADAICQQESTLVIDRMTAMDLCRSVARAIPIDADDEDFIRVTTPMGGLPETLDRLMLRVAEAAEMPATLLFGQSPAGLNATGESDIRLFYDGIKAMQEETVRPGIDRILDVLLASKAGPTKGVEPENWSYKFNPLWQETDKQQAETRKITAETDEIYINSGVLDEEEVAMSRFGGDTYSTDTVLDTEKRENPEPEPEIDAAAAAAFAANAANPPLLQPPLPPQPAQRTLDNDEFPAFFYTSLIDEHVHSLELPRGKITQGVFTTGHRDGHVHVVAIEQEIEVGEVVTLTTSEASGHTHPVEIRPQV